MELLLGLGLVASRDGKTQLEPILNKFENCDTFPFSMITLVIIINPEGKSLETLIVSHPRDFFDEGPTVAQKNT